MRTAQFWNPWQDLEQFRRGAAALLDGNPRWGGADGPPVNVDVSEEGVVLTAELPGFDAESFEVSTQGDAVTIRGSRPAEANEADSGRRYHLRERTPLEFEQTLRLPFAADPEQTDAAYEKGVLTVTLHRPEQQKPRKIGVRTA